MFIMKTKSIFFVLISILIGSSIFAVNPDNDEINAAILVYNSHAFNPAGEDDDDFAEGGESIGLKVNLFNSGTETATNVSAILSCTDPDILITDDSENFPSIVSDGDVWCIGDFDFDIDENCEEHFVDFTLTISSDQGTWTSPFQIHIFPANEVLLPVLLYNSHAYDPAGDDDDDLPEGGESIGLLINIFNSGVETATNIDAVISCTDADITIIDNTASFPDIMVDGNAWCEEDFDFDIADDCIEKDVEFTIEMESSEGIWTNTFIIHILPANEILLPSLVYNSHEYNPAGNDNDDLPEGGESIGLLINIFNSGVETATNIDAVISCSDDDITIIDNSASFPNIMSDSNAWCVEDFDFDIAEDCIEKDVEFSLEMESSEGIWTSTFIIHILPANEQLLPTLIYNSHSYNPAGDDDDNLPEGGESIGLMINVFNSGVETATNIDAIISCTDADITIIDNTASFPNIMSDSNAWTIEDFDFEIAEDCIEKDVEFSLEMESSEGIWTNTFIIHILQANEILTPILTYNTHAYDPAGDDDDDLPEGGESIGLLINIFNSGVETATSIDAIISCDDVDITLIDSITSFPNIMSDSNAWCSDDFDFDIHEECIEKDVEFTIEMESNEGIWTSTFVVHILPANEQLLPTLLYNTHIYNPAGADDDDKPEAGESIGLSINLFNSGIQTATDINAVITCADPDITITDHSESYPNIMSDSNAWCFDTFEFDISPNATEHEVEFSIEMTSDEGVWTSTFQVQIFEANLVGDPILLYNNHEYSPAGDDDDGRVEGGETVTMLVSIYNSGLDTARNVHAIITCADSDITITSAADTYENIDSDSEVWNLDGFTFDVDPSSVEQDIEFSFQITSDEGVWMQSLIVHVYEANDPPAPILLYNNHEFSPAGSDDDGFAEGSENIGLLVSLFNSGISTANNISSILTCSDPDITISDSIATFSDIDSDEEVWSTGGYYFSIDPDCLEHNVIFTLKISTDEGIWVSPFLVHIYPTNYFGIAELPESINIAYPNPNNGVFKLRSNDFNGKFEYMVYDIYGKLHQSGEDVFVNNNDPIFNLSELNTGVFFLKINMDGIQYVQKIIIQ